MITVSVTDFRKNLSGYIRKVKYMGEKVVVVDEKIGEPMVEVSTARKVKTDVEWEKYMKFVDSMFGAWKDLPEDINRKAMKEAGVKKIRKLRSK